MQATAKPKVLPQRPAQRLIIVRSLHACCGLVRAGWIGPEKVFGARSQPKWRTVFDISAF